VVYKQKLTPEQALQKVKHYCAYQERCHYEVKEKLFTFGLYKTEVEKLLSQLIEEDYLNEERFAIGFAGGRFRLKQWGKVKIEFELKQKKVSSYIIKKAIKAIDEDDYNKTLYKLTLTKWTALKQEQHISRLAKTTSFLIQRGFEPQLIGKVIASIRNEYNTN
jgi:regulatory protein